MLCYDIVSFFPVEKLVALTLDSLLGFCLIYDVTTVMWQILCVPGLFCILPNLAEFLIFE